jgi:hypothetical protein
MNREIKFRAWDKEHRKMWFQDGRAEPDFSMDFQGGIYHHGFSGDGLREEVKKMDFELMQFTGLKDKNGVEIYEGDVILADSIMIENPILVEWINDSCGFEPFSDSKENCHHCGGGINPDSYDIKVIGNIYENPGLLEVKK